MNRINVKSLKKRTSRGMTVGGTLSRERKQFLIANDLSITKVLEWALDRIEEQLQTVEYKDGKVVKVERIKE